MNDIFRVSLFNIFKYIITQIIKMKHILTKSNYIFYKSIKKLFKALKLIKMSIYIYKLLPISSKRAIFNQNTEHSNWHTNAVIINKFYITSAMFPARWCAYTHKDQFNTL